MTLVVAARPPAPVPAALTRVQFMLVAASIGLTLEAMLASVAAFGAANGYTAAEIAGVQIRLAEGVEFDRDSPLIDLFAADMGLTASQVDDLFRLGATL